MALFPLINTVLAARRICFLIFAWLPQGHPYSTVADEENDKALNRRASLKSRSGGGGIESENPE